MERITVKTLFGTEWSVSIGTTVLEYFDSYEDACAYADKVKANLLESAAESHFTAWQE